MFIESTNDNKRFKLGKMTNLKIVTTTTKSKSKTTSTKKPTKTMIISLDTFELLKNHSRKYYNQVMNYDEIIEELCTLWNEKHEQKWFLT